MACHTSRMTPAAGSPSGQCAECCSAPDTSALQCEGSWLTSSSNSIIERASWSPIYYLPYAASLTCPSHSAPDDADFLATTKARIEADPDARFAIFLDRLGYAKDHHVLGADLVHRRAYFQPHTQSDR